MVYSYGVAADATLLERETFLCGPKDRLIEALSPGGELVHALPGKCAEYLCALAETLSPGRDVNQIAMADMQHFGQDGKPVGIKLCALPTQCSRHNSPAHPHAITDFVRNKAGNRTNIEIILVLADVNHSFAAGIAVARAFSHFSTKASYGGSPGMGGKGHCVVDYADGAKHLASGRDNGYEPVSITFVHPSLVDGSGKKAYDVPKMQKALSVVAQNVMLAARLVDAPTNYMHTDACVEEARAVFESVKGKVDGKFQMIAVKGEELKDNGLGLLWGVGKAAVHKPALVVLSYAPDDASEDFTGGVALCGKGIVYDTGGLSIKGKTFMPGMKRDMGGAAAVLAGWCASVQLGAKTTIHAVMALAENSVGPESTRPDDIHTGFSGKTVEVVNTDAEGRLALGDAVAFSAKVLKVTTIIDAATLTGAKVSRQENAMQQYTAQQRSVRALQSKLAFFPVILHSLRPMYPSFGATNSVQQWQTLLTTSKIDRTPKCLARVNLLVIISTTG